MKYIILIQVLLFTACGIIPKKAYNVKNPIDEKMGEIWLSNGKPPSRQNLLSTPNIALLNDTTLWEIITKSDPINHSVIISLKLPELKRGYFKGLSLISNNDFLREKSLLLITFEGLKVANGLTENSIISLSNGNNLPIFNAQIKDIKTLIKLRQSPFVDYIEPKAILFDFLACGYDPYKESSDLRARDEKFPGEENYPKTDIIPDSYRHHHIQEAWGREHVYSPGKDQRICILDSGVSSDQNQFFNNYAFGHYRTPHLRLNETNETINDECFHGTKVASIAAAPRDLSSVVGIAWASPLITIKVVHSPLAHKGDVSSICRGIKDAVNPPDDGSPACVVAMAFGLTYYSPTIAQAIESAYLESPTTVFVAAAGSIVSEVVFPANLDNYVIAVSMVEIKSDIEGYRLMGRPATVAYGKSVDFVSVSTSDGIPASGLIGNHNEDQIAKFRYSSAATGIYTGIVALAWQYAKSQNWNRSELLELLRLSASRKNIRDFSGEPLEAIVGAGIIDAYRATGGARKVIINAPYEIELGTNVNLHAETDAIAPMGKPKPKHFEFEWYLDNQKIGTGDKTNLQAPSIGLHTIKVISKDKIDNKTLSAVQSINVVQKAQPPMIKEFIWTSYVADWASFFNGGRHDRWVNSSVFMPQGCKVQSTTGILICEEANYFEPCPKETPTATVDKGNIGFSVSKAPATEDNDLETLIHQWHDGASIVRTSVIYKVLQPTGVDCKVAGVLENFKWSDRESGTFFTEDHDVINFRIDRNAVNSNSVELKLSLGQGVTWWKAVNISDGIGNSRDIECEGNFASSSNTIWSNQVGNGQCLTFKKAKAGGYHQNNNEGFELCGLEGLTPGSSVTFTWVKD